MRALIFGMTLILVGISGCKPLDFGANTSKNADSSKENASVTGNMCDQLGGRLASDNTCRCENGVAIFKLLGQTCAQMLARQKSECTSRDGQILYDDEKCLCFPDYDLAPAGAKCKKPFLSNTSGLVSTTPAEQNPKGACAVVEKSSGNPHKICFDSVDLEGCDQSFQVAFEQMKPNFYEIVFFPGKSCVEAQQVLKSAAR